MVTTTLQTSFGAFTGEKSDGITQYRGIKYADIGNQLSPPEMVTSYGNEPIDATKFGSALLPPFCLLYLRNIH